LTCWRVRPSSWGWSYRLVEIAGFCDLGVLPPSRERFSHLCTLYPPSRLDDHSAAFYLYASLYYGPLFFPIFMFTEHVGWVRFAQRLKGIWRCLFPVVRNEPDTPQPSVCCFFYLSPAFSFKTAPFDISMAATTTCLLCCASLPPICLR